MRGESGAAGLYLAHNNIKHVLFIPQKHLKSHKATIMKHYYYNYFNINQKAH